MKNVCFFNSVEFWGGGEKLHLEYALEFKKKGYNVIIASKNNSPLNKKAELSGLEVFGVTINNLSFLNPFKILNLVIFFKRKKIDTVIFSGSHDLKIGCLSAKLAGIKKIVYLRGLAAPIKNSLINRITFKYFLTHIVANSDETKRSILQNIEGYIDESKVKTIYHGIEINNSTLNRNNKLIEITSQSSGVILGNAGRLTKQKGQHHLIEVARKLKEKDIAFTLFIAGTGEMQTELEVLIQQYELQKEVILLGFVKDMVGFMNSIDIFLLTSIWEGFGYVIVEAMIKSKPVVAFDISSNPEIIVNNKTGFLVNYPDLEEFELKTELLIKNEALRQEFGKSGNQRVLNQFDISDRITEFENYLLFKN